MARIRHQNLQVGNRYLMVTHERGKRIDFIVEILSCMSRSTRVQIIGRASGKKLNLKENIANKISEFYELPERYATFKGESVGSCDKGFESIQKQAGGQ